MPHPALAVKETDSERELRSRDTSCSERSRASAAGSSPAARRRGTEGHGGGGEVATREGEETPYETARTAKGGPHPSPYPPREGCAGGRARRAAAARPRAAERRFWSAAMGGGCSTVAAADASSDARTGSATAERVGDSRLRASVSNGGLSDVSIDGGGKPNRAPGCDVESENEQRERLQRSVECRRSLKVRAASDRPCAQSASHGASCRARSDGWPLTGGARTTSTSGACTPVRVRAGAKAHAHAPLPPPPPPHAPFARTCGRAWVLTTGT